MKSGRVVPHAAPDSSGTGAAPGLKPAAAAHPVTKRLAKALADSPGLTDEQRTTTGRARTCGGFDAEGSHRPARRASAASDLPPEERGHRRSDHQHPGEPAGTLRRGSRGHAGRSTPPSARRTSAASTCTAFRPCTWTATCRIPGGPGRHETLASAHGVYAHELTHAIDGPQYEISWFGRLARRVPCGDPLHGRGSRCREDAEAHALRRYLAAGGVRGVRSLGFRVRCAARHDRPGLPRGDRGLQGTWTVADRERSGPGGSAARGV